MRFSTELSVASLGNGTENQRTRALASLTGAPGIAIQLGGGTPATSARSSVVKRRSTCTWAMIDP